MRAQFGELVWNVFSENFLLSFNAYQSFIAQGMNGFDELSRTILVDNIPLDAAKTPDVLLEYFGAVGEVKYMRLASGRDSSSQSLFVEFT